MVEKEFKIGAATIRFIKGDITEVTADAIVNAANHTLMGGGGVDGAIHRKGGPKILEECKKIRATDWPEGLPTGKAVVTTGGHLKAKNVIHTVGPVWRGGGDDESGLLAEAYVNSLRVALTGKLRTIAFPSISTGAFGYPVQEASRIAVTTVKRFLEREDSLDDVVFVLFSDLDLNVYVETASEVLAS
jgi:O-acetyl-ADP-ribose deacetylase (regulator of RNase III)